MKAVLGLDTSNYRTSAALAALDGTVLLNERELLPVEMGKRGLRQSDAVYAHLKQLKPMTEKIREASASGVQLAAVCASVRPRDREDSYMPVFEVGDTLGRAIAAAEGIPFFPTDHQQGHLRAAAHGTPMEREERYLALHLSGGTTDLLLREPTGVTELGTSLDLHAGQLIDRVGVALGCAFPAGPQMECLARQARSEGRLGCAMEDHDLSCHLSGAEAQAMRWIREGQLSPGQIAREIFDLLARTVCRMLLAGSKSRQVSQALVCGGVASSALFREMLQARMAKKPAGPRICFGEAELSGDNAVGVALIGLDRLRKMKERSN